MSEEHKPAEPRGKPRYPLPPYHEEGTGPVLILVPGLDGTAELFYRQVPLLERHFHVVTFPLPNDSRCTMTDLVEELRLLVDEIRESASEDRVYLCGESFGGALSLSFGLAYPERLHGLIIVNSFPWIRRQWQLRLGPLALKLIPWAAMRLARRFTESRLHSPRTHADDMREFHERTRSINPTGYRRRLEILRDYDIRERLHEIQVPTLLLASDRDRLLPSVEQAQFMSARIPNADMQVLEGFGHICLIHHELNLMDYLSDWMSRLGAVEESSSDTGG